MKLVFQFSALCRGLNPPFHALRLVLNSHFSGEKTPPALKKTPLMFFSVVLPSPPSLRSPVGGSAFLLPFSF